MTAESRKSPHAGETTDGHESVLLTPEERAQLRARSMAARDHAQLAAVRCHELQREFETRVADYARWRESLDRAMPDLREWVARYARCLKEEGEAPQRMLVLVKQAVHEVVPSSEPDASTVLDLVVGFAIQAYYDTAA